jgi:hypothetical protein
MTPLRFAYRPPVALIDARRLTCTWCGQEFRSPSANAKICPTCKATDRYKEYARVRKLEAVKRSNAKTRGRNEAAR